ncbi:hypothetical protein [Actinoplanes sp. NPDC026623]|uniref:hypothetical protein n=1 Tax=Actinoplanes sp. NPDC026623 TaxID=3155610 RepID=UPI0033EC2510
MDVYVWLSRCDAGAFADFVARYVDTRNPGDERLSAFLRAYVTGGAGDADRAAIADLRRDDDSGGAFSLYLNARHHDGAVITVTREGAAVLGLTLDDPDDSAEVEGRARALVDRLRAEFAAAAGCAGTELPPAHSRQEWEADGLVRFRVGELPRASR